MRIRVTKDNFIMENKSCLHFDVRCLNGLRAKQINYSPLNQRMENGIKIFKGYLIFHIQYRSFVGYRVTGGVNDNHSPICRKRRTSFYYTFVVSQDFVMQIRDVSILQITSHPFDFSFSLVHAYIPLSLSLFFLLILA